LAFGPIAFGLLPFGPNDTILIAAISHETAQLMRQIPEQPKRELLVISKNSGGELLQASPL